MRDATAFDTPLYRGKLTLWVEDDLTRHFLTRFWGPDPDITIYTAGGREGVACMVRNAPAARAGRSIVGLVDRDFEMENRTEWTKPDVTLLRTTRHEFENYLLDFEALSKLSGKSPLEVEDEARGFAIQLVWWMACKEMLHILHRDCTADFPGEPALPPAKQAPRDATTAAEHLFTSDFWRERARLFRVRYSEQDVLRRLEELGAYYGGALQGEAWQECFSGKEILRHLRSHLPGLDRNKGGPASSPLRDEDLAKQLAELMRKRTDSPPAREELMALRRALRGRAGLRV